VTLPGGDRPRDGLRASDADRDDVADRLRQQCAAGRITLEELSDLLGRAYASRTYGDLDGVLGSLPVPAAAPTSGSSVPAGQRTRTAHGRHDRGMGLGFYLVVNTFLVLIWAITSPGGYFWPIWPILGMGFVLALAAVGGRGGPRGHGPRGRSGG